MLTQIINNLLRCCFANSFDFRQAINASIQETLDEYLAAHPYIAKDRNNFVFFSSKTNNYSHPIKRGQAWKFITSICHETGLSGNFGTHSLRKTWGYQQYRKYGVALPDLMKAYNHSSERQTLDYLCIVEREVYNDIPAVMRFH